MNPSGISKHTLSYLPSKMTLAMSQQMSEETYSASAVLFYAVSLRCL